MKFPAPLAIIRDTISLQHFVRFFDFFRHWSSSHVTVNRANELVMVPAGISRSQFDPGGRYRAFGTVIFDRHLWTWEQVIKEPFIILSSSKVIFLLISFVENVSFLSLILTGVYKRLCLVYSSHIFLHHIRYML